MTDDGARVVLQNVVFPDPEICPRADLFVRTSKRAVVGMEGVPLMLLAGGAARFDTYFNVLNLGTLLRAGTLDGLRLTLRGRGRVAVHVHLTPSENHGAALLHAAEARLAPEGVRIDLAGAEDAARARGGLGLVWFALTALDGEAVLEGGHYCTGPAARRRSPRIALAITTFRREAAVARTMARLRAFLGSEGAPPGMRAFVVDNGRSVEAPAGGPVEVIANPNLGGAGGFARGLAAARAGGFTHCLFMDDDAAFLTENLVRTQGFLSIAASDRAAVAGAMISAARPHEMWENGAVFAGLCRPRAHGADLTDPKELRDIEMDAALPPPRNFYGGWWYFAFPVEGLRRDPFPFFVRGDDSSFSLANGFDAVTLPGVAAFQDDFFAKESPLVCYLDARYHLHHHLVHPSLDAGPMGTLKVIGRLLMRSLLRFHYESAEAQLLAWEDVMRGPAFFEENADMAERRARLAQMTRAERWEPVEDRGALPPALRKPAKRTRSSPWVWTLNGHLMPGARRLARPVSVPLRRRGALSSAWGHGPVTYLSADGRAAYTVAMDRRRFFGALRRAAGLARRWRRDYAALRAAHREGYERLASPAFWAARNADPDREEAA